MSAPRGRFARHLDALPAPVGMDVETALAHPSLTALPTLLSPAATPYLETMAQKAREVTLQRFGRAVRLFAPLYVSNA
ncbi:MAG: hypothetical protein WCD35_04515 [Mycobacteriales bacterium]